MEMGMKHKKKKSVRFDLEEKPQCNEPLASNVTPILKKDKITGPYERRRSSIFVTKTFKS